jgi:hypothetical protein
MIVGPAFVRDNNQRILAATGPGFCSGSERIASVGPGLVRDAEWLFAVVRPRFVRDTGGLAVVDRPGFVRGTNQRVGAGRPGVCSGNQYARKTKETTVRGFMYLDFLIEYSSLRDFGPQVIALFLYEDF